MLLAQSDIKEVKAQVQELFSQSERLELEYFEVIDTSSFKPLLKVKDSRKTAMCIAAEIGSVRLIDNLLLNS